MGEHKNLEEKYQYEQSRSALAVLGGCAIGGAFEGVTGASDLLSVGAAIVGGVVLYTGVKPVQRFIAGRHE